MSKITKEEALWTISVLQRSVLRTTLGAGEWQEKKADVIRKLQVIANKP